MAKEQFRGSILTADNRLIARIVCKFDFVQKEVTLFSKDAEFKLPADEAAFILRISQGQFTLSPRVMIFKTASKRHPFAVIARSKLLETKEEVSKGLELDRKE